MKPSTHQELNKDATDFLDKGKNVVRDIEKAANEVANNAFDKADKLGAEASKELHKVIDGTQNEVYTQRGFVGRTVDNAGHYVSRLYRTSLHNVAQSFHNNVVVGFKNSFAAQNPVYRFYEDHHNAFAFLATVSVAATLTKRALEGFGILSFEDKASPLASKEVPSFLQKRYLVNSKAIYLNRPKFDIWNAHHYFKAAIFNRTTLSSVVSAGLLAGAMYTNNIDDKFFLLIGSGLALIAPKFYSEFNRIVLGRNVDAPQAENPSDKVNESEKSEPTTAQIDTERTNSLITFCQAYILQANSFENEAERNDIINNANNVMKNKADDVYNALQPTFKLRYNNEQANSAEKERTIAFITKTYIDASSYKVCRTTDENSFTVLNR